MVEIVTDLALSPSDSAILRRAVHDDLGTDLQSLMFIPSIGATFSAEQCQKWVPLAKTWKVIGAYCQTELGHGSNVRALETTITYMPETEQFDVHSPTITSTKWWPGSLGQSANHGMVYGRLIINGKDYGVHNFMVQVSQALKNSLCVMR